MLALLALTILLGGLGKIAWLAVAGVALHLAWQILVVDIDNPADCLEEIPRQSLARLDPSSSAFWPADFSQLSEPDRATRSAHRLRRPPRPS